MTVQAFRIETDDVERSEVHALLTAHLNDMHAITPLESVHALDIADLRRPGVTFWTAWSDADLLGCGALKHLDDDHGEVKSMRTTPLARGHGVASRVLAHIADYRPDPCSVFLTRLI